MHRRPHTRRNDSGIVISNLLLRCIPRKQAVMPNRSFFSVGIILVVLFVVNVVSSFTGGRHSRIVRNDVRRFNPLRVELRLMIEGTKNVYTTARAGDVLVYRTKNMIHGGKLTLGVLTEDGMVIPLCRRKDSEEFYLDRASPPLSAEVLRAENQLLSIMDSDRCGKVFIIDQHLDDTYFVPICENNDKSSLVCSTSKSDVIDLEIAQLELNLALKKIESRQLKCSTGVSAIKSLNAPNPVGPYSQATTTHGMVFASGCIGLDPKTGKLVAGSIEDETLQSMKNLQSILEEAGTDVNSIAKTTIFVTDLKQYAVVNKIYSEFFKGNKAFPARTTVEVSALPLGAKVEIEAIAFVTPTETKDT